MKQNKRNMRQSTRKPMEENTNGKTKINERTLFGG